MKKVIIIGGGFAGLSCAGKLAHYRKELDIIVIDKSALFNFLPSLPDCIGRGIDPAFLTYPIAEFCRKHKIDFLNGEIKSVNCINNQVITQKEKISYDFLVVASGSETNFYGNSQIQANAFKLDNAQDAQKIKKTVETGGFRNFVVSGGGYTGVEIATNLRVFLDKNFREDRIFIVERSPSILGPLPQWMKDYCLDNLNRLRIEIITSSTIDNIEADRVFVSGKPVLDKAMLIWAAGVKIPDFTKGINTEKNPQGRMKTDEYLRVKDNCFVLGDSALVAHESSTLRMAVQFAIYQGASAAGNIIRTIKGKPLKRYIPVDLGYIIPMANNRSCGNILGLNLKGRIPTLMHFLMCIYRSIGIKNRIGIIRRLLFP